MADLGFDIVKIFDPTGISSYGDVYEAGKRFYEDPSLKNAGLTLWEVVGALPMIGKFTKIPNRFIKISRRIPKITLNGAKRIESINRKIDTVPEWIPFLRPATSKIQDYTSELLFPWFKRKYLTGVNNVVGARRIQNANTMVDIVNTANALNDAIGFVQDLPTNAIDYTAKEHYKKGGKLNGK